VAVHQQRVAQGRENAGLLAAEVIGEDQVQRGPGFQLVLNYTQPVAPGPMQKVIGGKDFSLDGENEKWQARMDSKNEQYDREELGTPSFRGAQRFRPWDQVLALTRPPREAGGPSTPLRHQRRGFQGTGTSSPSGSGAASRRRTTSRA